MYYTYILKCFDNSYYVGSTDNLIRRLKEHNSGKAANFTSQRMPCEIIWYEKHQNRKEAVERELKIKKFSRSKKENLIFTPKTIWRHFKGNKYTILNVSNDFIYYAELEKWNEFLKNYKKAGSELQIWLRHKNQWLNIKSNNNQKTLRFNLIY